MALHPIPLNFHIYEDNFLFFSISVPLKIRRSFHHRNALKRCGFLTLSLPSSDYYTSPLSLSARNFPPPSPAITCILYIILPSERNFYPQVDKHRNRFCQHAPRVFYRIPPSESKAMLPQFGPIEGLNCFFPDFQPMSVSEEPA